MKHRLQLYYRLTKPGIIYGNTFHLVAGYIIALNATSSWRSFFGVTVGTALIIASACVLNNIIDRRIDRQMKRTKNRAVASGEISVKAASVYGVALAIIGFSLLALTTNLLTIILGVIAYVMYVVVYGYVKRRSPFGTLVGTIPGAIPLVAGYVADSGVMTLGAWLLFALLVAWQMPHFYAIAIYRRDEYKQAGVPVLSVMRPVSVVRQRMVGYGTLYLLAAIALGITQTVGPISAVLVVGGAVWWLASMIAVKKVDEAWARRIFKQSLVLTILLFVAACLSHTWR